MYPRQFAYGVKAAAAALAIALLTAAPVSAQPVDETPRQVPSTVVDESSDPDPELPAAGDEGPGTLQSEVAMSGEEEPTPGDYSSSDEPSSAPAPAAAPSSAPVPAAAAETEEPPQSGTDADSLDVSIDPPVGVEQSAATTPSDNADQAEEVPNRAVLGGVNNRTSETTDVVRSAPNAPGEAPGFTQSGNGVRYVNRSAAPIVIVVVIDGVEKPAIVVQPGARIDLPGCAASGTCSYKASTEDGAPDASLVAKPKAAPIAPYVEYESTSLSEGYGGGFSLQNGVVVYRNESDRDQLVVSSHRFGGPVTVKAGQAVELPACMLGDHCTYVADISGGAGQLEYTSSVSVSTDGTVLHGRPGLGLGFTETAAGVRYTNTSDRVVGLDFSGGGESLQTFTVYPGESALLPECDNTFEECTYWAVEFLPDGGFRFISSTDVRNFPVDGPGPVDPSTPTPVTPGSPVVRDPTRVPVSRPRTSSILNTSNDRNRPGTPSSSSASSGQQGNSYGSGSTFLGPAPAPDINLCSQLGGFGGLTQTPTLEYYSYGCQAAQLSYEIGRGDFSNVLSTGLGTVSTVMKKAGGAWWLGGVALDVWTYAGTQATKTDWSQKSLANTVAYAATNPVVIVQETVKAIGVVASNIWTAFF